MGASLGSFLQLVAYRLPNGLSLLIKRSHCEQCKKPIPWFALIPVLGFFITKRACYDCKSPLSYLYPFIETISGLGTVLIFYGWKISFFSDEDALKTLILFYSAIPITLIDIKYRIIPNTLVLFLFLCGGILYLFYPGFYDGCYGILVAACLLLLTLLYLVIRKKEGMGMGDIKYLGAIGFLLGPQETILTITLASILGAFFGIALIIFKKEKSENLTLPFGPFIAIGSLLACLYRGFLFF